MLNYMMLPAFPSKKPLSSELVPSSHRRSTRLRIESTT